MLNRVILIGRVGADPELKYTPSGIPVAEFRIAVDRPMSAEARAQNQEKQTDWIPIVAWRQQAEFAAQYLLKGRLVAIEGKIHFREYVSNTDGQKRRVAEVVADTLKGLDRARDGEGGGSGDFGGSESRGYTGSRPAGGGYASGPRSAAPPPARSAAPASGGNEFNDDYSDLSDPFAE